MVQIIHPVKGLPISICLPFISHMVQIIPTSTTSLQRWGYPFISHMVQIIHYLNKRFVPMLYMFISHMVQIIRIQGLKTWESYVSFISHMVQIIRKCRNVFILRPLTQVYIPHGSDNTFLSPFSFNALSNLFISHMVQIIHSYPLNVCRVTFVYIPHGSDNTFLVLFFLELSLTCLYPTWFR